MGPSAAGPGESVSRQKLRVQGVATAQACSEGDWHSGRIWDSQDHIAPGDTEGVARAPLAQDQTLGLQECLQAG